MNLPQLPPVELPNFGWTGKGSQRIGTLWYFNIAMERSTIFNGKMHYKLPFSIAMLVYQRVST